MFVGHQKQWNLLKKMSQGDKLPQALLFTGQDSLGKKRVALEFIKLINCAKEGPVRGPASNGAGKPFRSPAGAKEGKPCGVCLACQLIEKQTHPDLLILSPGEREIQIGQVRDLMKQLTWKPQFFSQKAVIIDEAHTLNAEAQNCLLKTLEEPPGNAIFVLLTSLPEVLFGTIRSRCEVLKFYPVPEKELLEAFRARKALPNFQKVIAECSGKPGWAIAFFENEQVLFEKEQRVKTMQTLLKSGLSARLAFAKDFFNKETSPQQVEVFWEDLIRYLRALLLEKLGVGSTALLKRDPERYTLKQLKEILTLACDLKFLLTTTNINQRLCFENFILCL